jgi:hypothetical protein
VSDPKHAIATVTPGRVIEREHMSPVVAAILAHGNPDPAAMRELLAVQREWEAMEAKKSFARALVALKRDLPHVLARDKRVDYGSGASRVRYQHVTLAVAVDAVIDHLNAHGFTHSWVPRTVSERLVEVTCTLTHQDGHTESTAISAPPDTKGNKGPAQAIASTITLLQRYTLLALLGIATRDQVEPEGRPPAPTPDDVDPARNLRAAEAIARAGLDRETVEAELGRLVPDWTAADLERIRVRLREMKAAGREPGEEG